jgi:hypothetical protein
LHCEGEGEDRWGDLVVHDVREDVFTVFLVDVEVVRGGAEDGVQGLDV